MFLTTGVDVCGRYLLYVSDDALHAAVVDVHGPTALWSPVWSPHRYVCSRHDSQFIQINFCFIVKKDDSSL